MLCLSNLIILGAKADIQALVDQQYPIKIEQSEIPLFGGINSIRVIMEKAQLVYSMVRLIILNHSTYSLNSHKK